MASAAEESQCTHRAKRQHIDNSEDIRQLPYEILVAIFRTLPTPVIVHRVGAVCKDWHSIVKDDELWRLRCVLSELPSGFGSCFAYAQRQTMREQALDQMYGRAGLTQNWRKGLQLLSVLSDAGDDYAMALYGWALNIGAGIRANQARAVQILRQSKHVIARAYCVFVNIGANRQEVAYRLLSTECDASDPHVQFLLGQCYRIGTGEAQAMQCYESAGNHIGALNSLGLLLDGGESDDQYRVIALFTQAATQGHSFAQYNLGYCYEWGRTGVLEQDIVQAKHWYTLSADQGYSSAVWGLERLSRKLNQSCEKGSSN